MKKHLYTFLAFALIILSFQSCKKEDSEQGKMDFKFIGATDSSIVRGDSIDRVLQVYYLGGQIEYVTFSDSGLPNGVNISYEPSTLKPDGYIHQIITASASADTGTFVIKTTAISEQGKTFARYFSLYVYPVPNARPRIYLTGSGTIYHQLNAPWTEPGYLATDLEDGSVTASVQVSGTIDVNLVGNYQFIYRVTDSDGGKDSVIRNVIVQNDLNYLNGQFTCTTTTIPGGTVHNWITSLSSSLTVNNEFTIFKISDCFQANPLSFYMPVKDSIYVNPQTFTCITPTDTLSHTFAGQGTVKDSSGVIKVHLYYTDSYVDPGSGNPVTISKHDYYEKQ